MSKSCCANTVPGGSEGNCCAPQDKNPRNTSTLRKVAFMLLLPLVVAVTTYSIVTYEINQAAANAPGSVSVNGQQLIFIEKLEDAFLTDHDLIMVLLPGRDGALNPAIIDCVATTAETIHDIDDKDVGMFAISKGDSSISNATVLISARNSSYTGYGTGYRIGGEINETRWARHI
jgi:hypothetical protein